jgi:hypothetical protein
MDAKIAPQGVTLQANLQLWASPLLAPFEGSFYQQHPVLLRLAVLVPVFAVLGSHQQGKRSAFKGASRIVRVAHSSRSRRDRIPAAGPMP